MSTYAILLADDHTIVRRGIKRMIEENPDLEVVGEAGDGIDLLPLLTKSRANMVILDISMPKGKELLHHAISNGADGYMLKEESEKELYSAIEKIRQGGVYISPRLAEELADDYGGICHGTFNQALQVLTRREREILKLIVDGKSSREIADTLFISVRTVENHRSSIMEKMGVKRMVDLVKDAVQKGYIS